MGNELQEYNKPLTAAEIRANVNLIQEVMKSVMKGPSKECPEGVHYGIIPGTKKPTLYKAGSEKILATFRIAVELEVEDLSTHDSFRYRVKARGLIPSGEVIGCGIGECSTDEEKYRWRGVVNEKEWQATPEDRRRIKYCKPTDWNKEGEIKQVRTNPADLANTALKMAKKRAQIDLTLTATAASDVFDQDIEDLPPEYVSGMKGQPQNGKPEVTQPQSKKLTEAQEKYFPRIEAALVAIFGDDKAARDEKLIELTTWTKNRGKENEEIVHGTTDYKVITKDKTLEILCHKLEQLSEKKNPKDDGTPTLCTSCMAPLGADGKCHTYEDCPMYGGAV